MFIGHFALGFAAQRAAPRQSLATLILAPVFLDAVWPVLCLLGIERFHIAEGNTAFQPLVFDYYPWSHSLLMALAWGALFALVVQRLTGDRRGAILCFALVVSHWVLDWVSHVPDMPLWPGGEKLGLGLWRSIPATVAVESLLFTGGLILYFQSTKARDRTGTWALAGFITFLLITYLGTANGKAPPSEQAVLIPGLAAVIIMPLWARWIARHREVVA